MQRGFQMCIYIYPSARAKLERLSQELGLPMSTVIGALVLNADPQDVQAAVIETSESNGHKR